jgi:hypothetical protein
VLTGAEFDEALTDTLSKVALASEELVPLSTTSPTYNVCAILIV